MPPIACRSKLAGTTILTGKALKPFMGFVCLSLALHSTNHMLTFHWQLRFKCQLIADVPLPYYMQVKL